MRQDGGGGVGGGWCEALGRFWWGAGGRELRMEIKRDEQMQVGGMEGGEQSRAEQSAVPPGWQPAALTPHRSK